MTFVRQTPLMIVASLALSLLPSVTMADTKSLSGRQIMDEVEARHDKPFEFEIQKMTLVDKSGKKEVRDVRRFTREKDKAQTRYLTIFRSPSGIKGTAMLTWQNDSKADDQWLYLPAQGKKLKRIAKGGKRNYFMGTDYTYEDLVSEAKEKFSYDRQADEKLNGESAFVVKAMAKDKQLKKDTGYKYRLLWVGQKHFNIIRTDYFNRRGKLIKRQTTDKWVNVEGKAWRANLSTMEHLKNKHKTITEVVERSLKEADAPSKNFRKKTITSGKLAR